MFLNHSFLFQLFQLVDKLTTDEDIQDVELDLNDVSFDIFLFLEIVNR